MYKVVISDLDGTLLNAQHEVSDLTRSTLKTLVDGGVRAVLATGRHLIDVRGIRETLGFDCDLITANGALVSAADDELLFHHTLAPSIAEELIGTMQSRKGFDTNVYMSDAWYVPRELPDLLQYHKESGFTYTLADLPSLDVRRMIKVFFIGEHEILLDVEAELLERYGKEASIVFSQDDCLEVMAANVNKGNAARETLEMHGLQMADAVAFGDGMNDFEMLTMAGRGFVMENAGNRLKAALPSLSRAPSNAEDGVAQRLIEIFGL